MTLFMIKSFAGGERGGGGFKGRRELGNNHAVCN